MSGQHFSLQLVCLTSEMNSFFIDIEFVSVRIRRDDAGRDGHRQVQPGPAHPLHG